MLRQYVSSPAVMAWCDDAIRRQSFDRRRPCEGQATAEPARDPEAMLAEHGLKAGGSDSYRCDDPTARPVWIGNVLAPQGRGLNEEVVRSLLSGVRDRAALPPVVVVAEGIAEQVTLLDGLHRYRVPFAFGFRSIPCIQVSVDKAVGGYGYWRCADLWSRLD